MTTLVNVSCDFCGTLCVNRQPFNVSSNRKRNHGKYRCRSCWMEALTNHKGTPIHNSYAGAKQRCEYPKHIAFSNYGGRGIKFRWTSFQSFLADMGASHFDGATLERVDVNGDYCKENCVWIPASKQAHNMRKNIHTEEQVRKIRQEYADGTTQVELARRYFDSQGNISNIILNRTWANV